ncbi:permease-like cell division protein FtsX [Saccharopolyspora shandongensis]|uniref:permease-like cell division protein FtsX n=1 Tax=Saccharopolyspora shandongensis TaxID=418495 RepID=UPI0033D06D46
MIKRSNRIEPNPKPVRRRFPWLIGSAVIVITAVVSVLYWHPWIDNVANGPVPLAGHQLCGDQIKVNFDGDEDMRQAAEILRVDPRTGRLFTETKQEAYARFQEIFKDMPDLLTQARPEALPASLHILPRSQGDLRAWANELRARLPQSTDVVAYIRADLAAQLEDRGMEPPSPCPPSGEFPPN